MTNKEMIQSLKRDKIDQSLATEYEARIADPGADLTGRENQYRELLAAKDGEIRELRQQMAKLMDIKVALDMEIAAYWKLLRKLPELLSVYKYASRTPTHSRGSKTKCVQNTSETVTQSESIITPDEPPAAAASTTDQAKNCAIM